MSQTTQANEKKKNTPKVSEETGVKKATKLIYINPDTNMPFEAYEMFKQVQTILKVGKTKFNSFAKFNYRSVEDIYNAFNALGAPLTLVLSDKIISVNDKVFVEATATVKDLKGNEVEKAIAHAELGIGKAGMSSEQATGSASSYARKYALNGLFLLDDSIDVDSLENKQAPRGDTDGDTDASVLDTKRAIQKLQGLIRGNSAKTSIATKALNGRSILKISLEEINGIIKQIEDIK